MMAAFETFMFMIVMTKCFVLIVVHVCGGRGEMLLVLMMVMMLSYAASSIVSRHVWRRSLRV